MTNDLFIFVCCCFIPYIMYKLYSFGTLFSFLSQNWSNISWIIWRSQRLLLLWNEEMEKMWMQVCHYYVRWCYKNIYNMYRIFSYELCSKEHCLMPKMIQEMLRKRKNEERYIQEMMSFFLFLHLLFPSVCLQFEL